MKRCNPNARAKCPDGETCELYAKFADGSWCDDFNERVLSQPMTNADHLVANGVTVQQWIPVTERLPEMKTDVLMYFRDDKNATAGFLCDVDEDRSMWCAYTDGGFYTDCDYEPTHWMPLPEPPKEEYHG